MKFDFAGKLPAMLEASLFATLGFTGRRESNQDLLLLKETFCILYV